MKKIDGLITALITPFKNGKVDFSSLEKLVRSQIENGVEGFVVNGTTGESPTLTTDEKEKIFFKVKELAGENRPVILGTGSNSTEKTIIETIRAKELGADAALVVVPYYNKPPQRGLIQHFTHVANKSNMPIILYNVPGRTVAALQPESVAILSQQKNIIGIKEATGDIQIEKEIIAKKKNKDFILLSGDDGTYVDFLEAGGNGVISVTSHIIPKEMKKWRQLISEEKISEARADIQKYKTLIDLLFIEANPIPVKKALQLMGQIDSAELRLPLVELEESNTEILKSEMKKLGVLK